MTLFVSEGCVVPKFKSSRSCGTIGERYKGVDVETRSGILTLLIINMTSDIFNTYIIGSRWSLVKRVL